MKTSFFKSIIIFAFICGNIFAQGETALPFLTLPLLPNNIAVGGAGTSLLDNNEFGFLMNPALIGTQSEENHLGANIYPSKSKIGNNPYSEIFSSAVSLGYNLEKHTGLPIGIGFGYARGKAEYSFKSQLNNQSSYDNYHAYSFGVLVDLRVNINIGLNYKKINSILDPPKNIRAFYGIPYEYSGKAYDVGILFHLPLSELLSSGIKPKQVFGIDIYPTYDLAIGYSVLNIGDEVNYFDPAQTDPLPRTERLGYSLSFSIMSIIKQKKIELLGFDFTVDAENSLVSIMNITPPPNVRLLPQYEYESILGEINIFKNLIGVKGDENVIIHTGFNITLFETLSILKGHLSGRYMGLNKSNGFIVHSDGAFKLLSNVIDLSTLQFFFDNFYLKYYTANYLVDQPFETKFNSISFGYKGPFL